MNMITNNGIPNPEWGHSDTGKAADNGVCYINYTREQLLRMLNGDRTPQDSAEAERKSYRKTKELYRKVLGMLRKGPVPSADLKRKYGSALASHTMQRLRKDGCIIECVPGTLPDGRKDRSNCTYRLISDENYREK